MMTANFSIIILLSLMGVCPTASWGDICLGNLGVSDLIAGANDALSSFLTYGDILPRRLRNADPCTSRGCEWQKRGTHVTIPFSISRHFNREEKLIILGALESFHLSTCIKFTRRIRQRDYLHFFPGKGCWSYLGRTNGRQPISLAKNKCMAKGIVQHEVLHALGFHHEQNRSDRDSYVNILYQNIIPDFRDQFTKVDTNNLGTLYDFDSIMHYSNMAFSRNKKPTIISKRFPGRRFGTANEMNSFDIARVNALYGYCSSQN